MDSDVGSYRKGLVTTAAEKPTELIFVHRVDVADAAQDQVIFDPMMGKQTCCGTVISTRYAAFIIAVIELIALFFFIMNLPEILVKDGYLFYTDVIQGHGRFSFGVCVFISVVSTLAITLMLIGLKTRDYRQLIPHLIWQGLLVLLSLIQITLIGCLLYTGEILVPAGLVLITFFTLIILMQLWWFLIILNCCLDFRDKELRGEKDVESPDVEIVPTITVRSASITSMTLHTRKEFSDYSYECLTSDQENAAEGEETVVIPQQQQQHQHNTIGFSRRGTKVSNCSSNNGETALIKKKYSSPSYCPYHPPPANLVDASEGSNGPLRNKQHYYHSADSQTQFFARDNRIVVDRGHQDGDKRIRSIINSSSSSSKNDSTTSSALLP